MNHTNKPLLALLTFLIVGMGTLWASGTRDDYSNSYFTVESLADNDTIKFLIPSGITSEYMTSSADRKIGVFQHVAPPTRLRLEFSRETGLILRRAGMSGNPFQTKQGRRSFRPRPQRPAGNWNRCDRSPKCRDAVLRSGSAPTGRSPPARWSSSGH